MSESLSTRLPERELAFEQLPERAGLRLFPRIEWVDRIPSTNSALRQRADAGEPEGLVLVADVQTAGRGQRTNQWASPPGGLWFSVLLRPRLEANQLLNLMPACGEVLAATLLREFALPATVKHPNDVLVEGRKLCGILAEASSQAGSPYPEYVVLGVGTNLVNPIPLELRERAVSLGELLPEPPPPERLLALWLGALQELMTR